LQQRRAVYAAAKARHPPRWGNRNTRQWAHKPAVHLNPPRAKAVAAAQSASPAKDKVTVKEAA
jgi:hypothetical protein